MTPEALLGKNHPITELEAAAGRTYNDRFEKTEYAASLIHTTDLFPQKRQPRLMGIVGIDKQNMISQKLS